MTPPRLAPEAVAAVLGELGPVDAPRGNRVRVRTSPDRILEALARARDRLACDHVVQVATADNGTTLELHYHLTGAHRTVVTIAVELPREAPRIASAAGILPPAGIYERQIHDLMGIVFEGHPDLRRIILTEDWPEGEYPLRKDWKMDPKKDYGGLGREGA